MGAGPKGPDKRKALAPHIMNSFFMKTKTIFASFSVCKKLDWMLCNLFNHAKKSGIRVLWALWPCKKNWIHFFWAFWACEKLNPSSISFFLLQIIVWVINYFFWTKDQSDTNNSLSTVIYFVNKKFNNTWLW